MTASVASWPLWGQTAPNRSNQLYPGSMPGSCRDAAIPRQQKRIQDLCQCDIHGVVSGEIATQFPRPRQKEIMRVSGELRISHISNRSTLTQIRDISNLRVATENLRDLDID